MTAVLAAASLFIRNIAAEKWSSELYSQKEKAFYLAEAGIEEAKALIAANNEWYTDAPHSPDDDANWLISGSIGSEKQLGGGRYRMVRESGENIMYSVGTYKQGKAVIRIKFITAPFRTYEFKIL